MTQLQDLVSAARMIRADIRAAGVDGVPAGVVQSHVIAAGYSYSIYFCAVEVLGRGGLLERRGQRLVAPVIPW